MIIKRKVVLDFDDTIAKSRERIVELLNEKNGTNKTVYDIEDWGYKSIDPNITPEEIVDLYSSPVFFERLELHEHVKEFISALRDKYTFIVCSVGSPENLKLKQDFIYNLATELDADIHFAGVLFDPTISSVLYDRPMSAITAGVGLKVYIPGVGPVSVDYGIPITNPGSYGSKGGYFTFGTGGMGGYGW